MGDKSSKRRKKKRVEDTSSSSSESPYSSEYSSSDGESDRKHSRRRRKHSSRHRDDRRRSSERSKSRREKREKQKKQHRRGKKKDSESGDEGERVMEQPEEVIRFILKEFPAVAGDLEQLLRMIDDGQAVDISGLSERSLVKHLRKLFLSLNLKETVDLVFLLPSNVCPTLEVVGSILHPNAEPPTLRADNPVSEVDVQSVPLDTEFKDSTGDFNLKLPSPRKDVAPKRRVIGPEMPSAELLAAAAKLTEAEAELREAEIDGDNGVFIGPPPPAVVKEAESANEAERFEEVTRIMGAEVDSPYDVVGVNRNMSAENIKKRYWKLSLMVHPDKCPHPQANQAFIILNKAFKDLQDPDKRKALDDKIIQKEEQEKFKAELKEMREAAHWRRLQGISMEGDEALLADMDVKVEPKREEWMTTLPPERKPGGMPTHSTTFSRNSREGRGDTSAWTDTPSDRAQKAKMNYLEAYNATAALASNDGQNPNRNMDAEMVDTYNKAKRSKSLVEKHKETAGKRYKKKSKQESSKEEWEGQHPWKPWDREKDLTAGRQNVKLDAENMSEGLSSRFSSGSFQRNFL